MGWAVTGPAAMTMAASENRQAVPLTFALCPDHWRTAELAEQLVRDAAQHVARASVNCALDALTTCPRHDGARKPRKM